MQLFRPSGRVDEGNVSWAINAPTKKHRDNESQVIRAPKLRETRGSCDTSCHTTEL